MLRIVGLLIALTLAAGGIGFYLGRRSVPSAGAVVIPPAPTPIPQTQTRSREQSPPEFAQPQPLPTSSGEPRVSLPISGLRESDLRDTFSEARGTERKHEAQDILAPRGTPVLAVDDGVVKKLFLSKPGGITVYQFDPSERWCYYYAHLDRYEAGIKEGMMLHRGQVLGYVGTTGNADPGTPHLHFAIFELGPEKQWWKGTPVNPYPLLSDAFRARR